VTGDQPIKVAVCGAAGSMGRTVTVAVTDAPDMRVVARIDPFYARAAADTGGPGEWFAELGPALAATPPDVVVDFTQPDAVLHDVLTALAHRVACVVGTTGLTSEQLELIAVESTSTATPVFLAPNFAVGAVLMMQFAQQAARHLHDCEIVELHHERKVDAPSGTAAQTGRLVEEVWQDGGIRKTVPIHSVRLPGLVAHQEVIFGSVGQTLTIRHDSLSRDSFVPGVLLAVRRVRGLTGLVVGLENLLS
jgi:4-hydroxy-tetrahydrodipicolinate reductase